MNRHTYSLLLYLVAPIIWCYFLFRAIKAPEYRNGFLQRLGLTSPAITTDGILIHCASVGETMAAVPLIKKLLLIYPSISITVTSTTPTGKITAFNHFADAVNLTYLPIDWPGSCRRFIKRVQPRIVILMETELWPNFLNQCAINETPVMLANARLSNKSLKKYLKHPKLTDQLFKNISIISAQFESDKQNFMSLGVASDKIEVVGSIKFDLKIDESTLKQQQQLKLQWIGKRPTWVAASIHPGEFEAILAAHKTLLMKQPDILLIAVPRHPEKFDELKQECRKAGLQFISRTDNATPDYNTKVVVGDTMGEMALFCGIADITFVGGSLIERGGHNPLEPIACGTPVVMGSHYYNFTDVCQILIDNDVMQVAVTNDELSRIMNQIFDDKVLLAKMSERATTIIQNNSGCTDKMIAHVKVLMNQ